MSLPRIVLTGASGFLGRHVIEALKDRYTILALARRSQHRAGIDEHPNIQWRQVDIGERDQVQAVIEEIKESGGADVVVHLAAYYDFTGYDHPEYTRTNVVGMRHVLELADALGVSRFIFSSSLAASAFPRAGAALNEASEPDGEHVYARSKRLAEGLVREYQDRFPAVIVRLAALFSDWCEYPPLFVFLNTWLSTSWNARILGGRGLTAIPYLHVRDAAAFFATLVDGRHGLQPGEVLIASPDEAVSHRDLFGTATLAYYGKRLEPAYLPRLFCYPGLWGLDLLGRLLGQRPFERPWMANYVDQEMRVDASLSRQVLGWEPRVRLGVLRRLPFLVENLKTDPHEWHRRNEAAMKLVWVSDYLKIYWLLRKHEAEIITRFGEALTSPEHGDQFARYQQMSAAEHDWHHKLILGQLMSAVRTGDKTVFTTYCRELALRRFAEGFKAEEFCGALELLNLVCLRVLRRDPESGGMRQQLLDYLTMTLRFGCDEAQDTFEFVSSRRSAPDTEAL